MPLRGLTISDAATSLSVTGGTSKTFTESSVVVPGGVNVADFAEANFLLRRHITFRNRNPQKQSDGTFSKAKRSFVFTTPVDAGGGKIDYLVTRVETEIPVSASASIEANHRKNVAQLHFDADVENFNALGTTA